MLLRTILKKGAIYLLNNSKNRENL